MPRLRPPKRPPEAREVQTGTASFIVIVSILARNLSPALVTARHGGVRVVL